MQQSLKFLFVINPISGGKKKQDVESAIRDYFKPLSHHIELFLMDGKNDAASLSHWIKTWQPDRVVAVGGDGTISLVAEQLFEEDIPVGIIPAGSANGMAKELQITPDIQTALDTIVNGIIHKADLIRINQKYFCMHLSDVGLNARLVKCFDDGQIRGFIGYGRALLKTLWKKQKIHVSIETQDAIIQREALMVVIANATQYGTGAVINPDGNMFDGLFEVIVVKKLAFSELVKMMFRAQRFNPQKVEVFHTRHITMFMKKNADFQVDGEYLGQINQLEATIEAARLTLLLPETIMQKKE